MWMVDICLVTLLIFIPNVMLVLGFPQPQPFTLHASLPELVAVAETIPVRHCLAWLAVNGALLAFLLTVRRHVLEPLRHIVQHLQQVRVALLEEAPSPDLAGLSLKYVARDINRFAAIALDYYHKHQQVSRELEHSRQIIAQFALQQRTTLSSTNREISEQYRTVLAYANYLEEQILGARLDPALRYDFDDVCESSFNLKLIAGALAALDDSAPAPTLGTVPLAPLMQKTMLALSPSLDRRSMKLTSAGVDESVAAKGDPDIIAHVLWMMLLGMIRYAAEESTLRIRCLHSRDGHEALVSIVVSELSSSQLSCEQLRVYLVRQLQHLTPQMFADSMRVQGNIQLAEMLLKQIGGSISILPLTVSACEICIVLPSAEITATCS